MRSAVGPVRTLTGVAFTAVFAVPLYVVIVNAFKPLSEITHNPVALPNHWTIENFAKVLSRYSGFTLSLLNSIMITATSALPALALAAGLGYVIARRAGLGMQILQLLLLGGLMIPTQVILVPIASVLDALGMLGTFPGLILFNIGYYLPFGVFIFARFARQVPRELDEAASIDGAGLVRTFFAIVLPIMRPALASVLIFLGVWIWNDFLNPLILLGPSTGTTVTTGIYQAVGMFQTDYGAIFALMVLAATPIVGLYLLMQRQFMEGLTSGALKG